MALHVALPRITAETERPHEAAAPPRRVSLTTYLELDPAIRFVIALALVAAISLLYLAQTTEVTRLNYKVQQLQVAHNGLMRDRQQLQLTIARAQALPHIQDLALHKLQMVPVGDQFMYVGVPPAGSAAPAGTSAVPPGPPLAKGASTP